MKTHGFESGDAVVNWAGDKPDLYSERLLVTFIRADEANPGSELWWAAHPTEGTLVIVSCGRWWKLNPARYHWRTGKACNCNNVTAVSPTQG